MEYSNQSERIKKDLDIYIAGIDKLYNEKEAIFLLKEYYINPINREAIRINGLQVNEGVFRAWYGFSKLFSGAISLGKFKKEMIVQLVESFQQHIQKLILSDDRPNASAYFTNMQKQLSVNGYMNMTLDKSFTTTLFNTNTLAMMSLILLIPEELRIEMGNYFLEKYVYMKYPNSYKYILIP